MCIALHTQIDGLEQPVSRLVYGMAIAPFNRGGDGTELLDAVLDSGINTFDLARVYGEAERSMGRWLAKRGVRERVVILTKGCHPDVLGRRRVSEKALRKDVEKSLSELGVDCIDIYLLHRDDPSVPAGEVVEWLNELRREGKINLFGGSNWTHGRIAEANAYAAAHGLRPFAVSSPNFGLAEQVTDLWGGGSVTVSGPENAAVRAWYRENRMPVFAYSSLAHGFFSGKMKSADERRAKDFLDSWAMKGYVCPQNFERLRRCEELAAEKGVTVPQLALRWIFSQGLNTFAIVSSASPERVRQNLAALQIPLTDEEAAWLDLRAERV